MTLPYGPHADPDADDGHWRDGGQRPCARGERCREAATVHDDQGVRRAPALGPRPFCGTDRSLVARAVEWTPERYLELAMRLGDRRGGDGPRVSGGGAAAPIPVRCDVDALMVQVVNIVASWDERVRTVAKLADRPGPPIPERRGSGTAGIALTRMCATLAAHLDALLALPPEPMHRYITLQEAAELATGGEVVGLVRPYAGYAEITRDLDGADAGLELLRLDVRCRHMLGWTPQHQHLPVPCWECGHRQVLRRWDGGAGLEDRVECTQCGEVYEGERFTLLMGEVEAAARAKQTKAAS